MKAEIIMENNTDASRTFFSYFDTSLAQQLVVALTKYINYNKGTRQISSGISDNTRVMTKG